MKNSVKKSVQYHLKNITWNQVAKEFLVEKLISWNFRHKKQREENFVVSTLCCGAACNFFTSPNFALFFSSSCWLESKSFVSHQICLDFFVLILKMMNLKYWNYEIEAAVLRVSIFPSKGIYLRIWEYLMQNGTSNCINQNAFKFLHSPKITVSHDFD